MRVVLRIALLVVAIGVTVMLVFAFRRRAREALAKAYEGLDAHSEPQPGDVHLKYETYHGLLVWVSVSWHTVWLPPDQARTLLKRLLRFNFTWGFFAYGAAILPLLSLGNYWAQVRSIRKQVAEGPGTAR